MSRLVVVSNRVAPVDEGAGTSGGLAVAVLDSLKERGGIWFGWSGEVRDQAADTPAISATGRITRATLDLTPADHEEYYNGYANRTLWPLLHYRVGLFEYASRFYAGYQRVNARFARGLAPMLKPDDLIWIHDYHLILLARELRRAGAKNHIGFFLHTPFPPVEVFAVLPRQKELVEALSYCDLIGFQTSIDLRAFQDYVRHEVGGTVFADDTIEAFGRRFRAGTFPISIDARRFAELGARGAQNRTCQRLRDSLVGRMLLIGVDRLDYSKGLDNRFRAFEFLLERHPEHRAQISFLQIAPPTREDVPEYRTIRAELEGLSGRINGRFAELDWVPIRYLNRSFGRSVLAGAFRLSRVGVVTPLRDGMNLVAKEFVAAQDPEDPGVLVLSRFAGAARELTSALIVNPFDAEAASEAIHQALTMPLDERRQRWSAMMKILLQQDVTAWRHGFLSVLKAT